MVNGRLSQRGIVRRGKRADVAGRRSQPFCQHLPVRALVHSGHRIELPLVPVRLVQGADPTGVVSEGVRVAQFRLEAKLVVDVADPISVVVDVNRVQNVVAELKEVWTSGPAFEGKCRWVPTITAISAVATSRTCTTIGSTNAMPGTNIPCSGSTDSASCPDTYMQMYGPTTPQASSATPL